MTNYFFISSPLHFSIAANIAIKNSDRSNVVVIISKNSAVGRAYVTVSERFPEIFNQVVPLFGDVSRKEKFGVLSKLLSQSTSVRIFTGNDRRSEFQYAMQVATKAGADVRGVYMDDGAVTYVGHKSMNRIQHRYIDPLFKKLFYGFWWKNAMTTGSSAWIDEACVAFPDAVHPLLKKKQLTEINADLFRSDRFVALSSALLGNNDYQQLLAGIRVVVALPHEAIYLNRPEIYEETGRYLEKRCSAEEIAVKAHPRSNDIEIVKQMFPGAVLLDRNVGMEFMLPLLHEECLVIGDISSTLLTTRWLRPDLAIIALKTMDVIPHSLAELYRKLNIEIISGSELSGALDRFDSSIKSDGVVITNKFLPDGVTLE